MQDWQKDIITKNGDQLALYIKGNASILAGLQAKGLISETESDELTSIGDNRGAIKQAAKLLAIIKTKTETDDKDLQKRIPAFEAFIQVLKKEKQSGAVNLLEKEKEEYLKSTQKRPQTPDAVQNVPSSSSSIPENTSNFAMHSEAISQLKNEYLAQAKKPEPLEVCFDSPVDIAPDVLDGSHVVSSKDRNFALLINIKQYPEIKDDTGKVIDRTRLGSELDLKYMKDIWSKLGYKIFRDDETDEERWTKNELETIINAFVAHCKKVLPTSIVIFIGGHGENGLVYTSDRNSFRLEDRSISPEQEIFFKFYDSNFFENGQAQKPITKIFLVNSCNVFRQTQADDYRIGVPFVKGMIVCHSQSPGGKAWRDPESGSWFVHCLAFYMMKLAGRKDLDFILEQVISALKERKDILKHKDAGDLPSQVAYFYKANLEKKIYFRF